MKLEEPKFQLGLRVPRGEIMKESFRYSGGETTLSFSLSCSEHESSLGWQLPAGAS